MASIRLTRRFSRGLFVLIHLKILRINMMMNGTGIIFPITAIIYAFQMSMPAATAIGIAPLNSTTGAMETASV